MLYTFFNVLIGVLDSHLTLDVLNGVNNSNVVLKCRLTHIKILYQSLETKNIFNHFFNIFCDHFIKVIFTLSILEFFK